MSNIADDVEFYEIYAVCNVLLLCLSKFIVLWLKLVYFGMNIAM